MISKFFVVFFSKPQFCTKHVYALSSSSIITIMYGDFHIPSMIMLSPFANDNPFHNHLALWAYSSETLNFIVFFRLIGLFATEKKNEKTYRVQRYCWRMNVWYLYSFFFPGNNTSCSFRVIPVETDALTILNKT